MKSVLEKGCGSQSGFTMLELMMAMGLAVVAAMAVGAIDQMMAKANRDLVVRTEWNKMVGLINQLTSSQAACSIAITNGGGDGKALLFDQSAAVPWAQMPMAKDVSLKTSTEASNQMLLYAQGWTGPEANIVVTAMFYQITPPNVKGNQLVDPDKPSVIYRYYPALLYILGGRAPNVQKALGGPRLFRPLIIPLNIITSVADVNDPTKDQIIGCVGNAEPQVSIIKALPTNPPVTKGWIGGKPPSVQCDPAGIFVLDTFNPNGCYKPCVNGDSMPGYMTQPGKGAMPMCALWN